MKLLTKDQENLIKDLPDLKQKIIGGNQLWLEEKEVTDPLIQKRISLLAQLWAR